MSKARNTSPRNVVALPKENHKHMSPKKLKMILDTISDMTSEDLFVCMDAITRGLVRQRDIASDRAVDFESAVANLVNRPKPTPKTWRFILDDFIKPHRPALRTGDWLIDTIEKRASPEKAKEDN